MVAEIGVIKTLLSGVLGGLAPAARANVYVPGPEMPSGAYTGTYPYISLACAHYSVAPMEAGAGGPIVRTDDADPNVYVVALVDKLTSESGTTLAATELFQMQFLDALNVAMQTRAGRYLIDDAGAGQATYAYSGPSDRNPEGPEVLLAGKPVTVRHYIIHTQSLPIPPTNP